MAKFIFYDSNYQLLAIATRYYFLPFRNLNCKYSLQNISGGETIVTFFPLNATRSCEKLKKKYELFIKQMQQTFKQLFYQISARESEKDIDPLSQAFHKKIPDLKLSEFGKGYQNISKNAKISR